MLSRHKQVFPYIVVLKQKHRRSAWLIGMLAAFVFILLLVARLIQRPQDWLFLLLTIIGFFGLLIFEVLQFRKKGKTEMNLVYFVAVASLFLLEPIGILAYMAVAFTGFLSTRPEEIGFSEQEIVFARLFSKKIQWSELNNALIKDGILTLDYKNNRLFQAETDDDEDNEDYDVSEEEFNAFCREQLALHNA
jgi:hypothetical protein